MHGLYVEKTQRKRLKVVKRVLILFFQLFAVGLTFMTPYIAAFLMMFFIE